MTTKFKKTPGVTWGASSDSRFKPFGTLAPGPGNYKVRGPPRSASVSCRGDPPARRPHIARGTRARARTRDTRDAPRRSRRSPPRRARAARPPRATRAQTESAFLDQPSSKRSSSSRPVMGKAKKELSLRRGGPGPGDYRPEREGFTSPPMSETKSAVPSFGGPLGQMDRFNTGLLNEFNGRSPGPGVYNLPATACWDGHAQKTSGTPKFGTAKRCARARERERARPPSSSSSSRARDEDRSGRAR